MYQHISSRMVIRGLGEPKGGRERLEYRQVVDEYYVCYGNGGTGCIAAARLRVIKLRPWCKWPSSLRTSHDLDVDTSE